MNRTDLRHLPVGEIMEDDMNINILVVEDDADINGLICKILQNQGYNARPAFSGSEAEMCLEKYEFQLVVLDLMLPGISGEQLIESIRRTGTMPVIVISAKPGQESKIEALRLGADDFIAKPFDNGEVAARVAAQLRRYMVFSSGTVKTQKIQYGDIVIDSETHKVYVNGTEVSLTVREFAILELMMSYPDKVFTKANLYEHVWNDTFFGDDNTLNVHISNLRSKLSAAGADGSAIKTVWGIGYKMA